MDKNFHMGYTTEDIIKDINKLSTVCTGIVVNKPKSKVKSINKKGRPIFIRRAK